jgi:cytochrome P450
MSALTGFIAAKAKDSSILGQLWRHHQTQKDGGLDDLEVASECADHFLAGIDTTSDTLMFLIWSLSQSRNQHFQQKLRREVLDLSEEAINEHGITRVGASDKCTYLNAIIKETLRLYAPLPSYEPRSMLSESVIDGYKIPARTVVGMSPFTMHRNPDIFEDPFTFNPDRWLGPKATEMDRWFWAFSSGGRMCIGLQYVFALTVEFWHVDDILILLQSRNGRDDYPRSDHLPKVRDDSGTGV